MNNVTGANAADDCPENTYIYMCMLKYRIKPGKVAIKKYLLFIIIKQNIKTDNMHNKNSTD